MMRVFVWLTMALFALNSCGIDKENALNTPIVLDSLASCPFMTEDLQGNPVISYVKEINDSVSVIQYCIYDKGSGRLSEPVGIGSSKNVHAHGENLPKIIFKPNKEIIVIWGAANPNPENKYSGMILYSQSFDNGNSWTMAKPLVTDERSNDQRYFDLALLPNGEAAIIWLDNREDRETAGSSLYFASTNGKNGFEKERMIQGSICPCCRTDLFVDGSGVIHTAFRAIINDSIRDMVHMESADLGKTFSAPKRISADNWVINGCPHTGPSMVSNSNGMHFAWYTGEEPAGVFYTRSPFRSSSYLPKDSVSGNGSAKHPQINCLDNDNMVLCWDETVKAGEKYNSRIGIQVRSKEGVPLIKKFISVSEDISEFPVLKSAGPNSVLIAYSRRMENGKAVICQLICF
jgi:hypothetical protein